MPNMRTPRGITPPAPGLDREEPTLVNEDDIPSSDPRGSGERASVSDERPARTPERE
jgi:hypothetical protein